MNPICIIFKIALISDNAIIRIFFSRRVFQYLIQYNNSNNISVGVEYIFKPRTSFSKCYLCVTYGQVGIIWIWTTLKTWYIHPTHMQTITKFLPKLLKRGMNDHKRTICFVIPPREDVLSNKKFNISIFFLALILVWIYYWYQIFLNGSTH